MARPDLRDPHKERQWRQRVAQWRHSGKTIREFCRRQGLAESAFYFWRREVDRRDRERAEPAKTKRRIRFAGRASPGQQRSSALFVPVSLTAGADLSTQPWTIEVVLDGGPLLRLRPGVDRLTLAEVLAVVRSCTQEARPC